MNTRSGSRLTGISPRSRSVEDGHRPGPDASTAREPLIGLPDELRGSRPARALLDESTVDLRDCRPLGRTRLDGGDPKGRERIRVADRRDPAVFVGPDPLT